MRCRSYTEGSTRTRIARSDNGTTPYPFTDNDIYSLAVSGTENGNCTQNDGVDAFADVSIYGWTSESDDVGTYLTPPSDGETIGTYSSWESSVSENSGIATATESGNDTGGYTATLTGGDGSGSSSGYGLPPYGLEAAGMYQVDAFDSTQVLPTNALGGSLLSSFLQDAGYSVPFDIAIVTPDHDRIWPDLPGDSGSYVVTLEDGRGGVSFDSPLTVIAYRGGMLLSGGTPGAGFNPTGNLGIGTAAADTNAATANGMPWQEETKLGSFVENIGVSDGVARDGPLSPTQTLTALAAPGRNPADITISTMTGGQGEGGTNGGHETSGGDPGAMLGSETAGLASFGLQAQEGAQPEGGAQPQKPPPRALSARKGGPKDEDIPMANLEGMLALIKLYVLSLKTNDPKGESAEYKQAVHILMILTSWAQQNMIKWEFTTLDILGEVLTTPYLRNWTGQRSIDWPFFIMLNKNKFQWKINDLKLEPGSDEFTKFLLMWSALILFHEGFHLLDEKVNGNGESQLEEFDARKAELGFYRFLKEKYGYYDKELDEMLKMTDAQIMANRAKQYAPYPKDRRAYNKKMITPHIP